MTLRTLIVALIVLFCAIYVPDAGHGFVKDDFQWIEDARQPVTAVFTTTNEFYRPLVTLSFRANYELFGVDSYPYGLTNVGLAAACAALVFALVRAFGLSRAAAAFGAAAWVFNLHGVNMGVLWLSGRTALILTLFALLAGIAFLRRRTAACLACITAALLSKEEAVLLPFALLLWRGALTSDTPPLQRWRAAVTEAWWVMLPLPLYAAARVSTNAIMPTNAPDYYALTLEPMLVGRNVLEYLDRSWTFAVAGLLLLWCVGRPALGIDAQRHRVALCGVIWFACGLAITVLVPVRSSLYACWPSTGAAVTVAAVADAWMTRMTGDRLRRAAVAAVVILTALLPVYRLRNQRWVEIADLSADTMATLQRCSAVRCHAIVLEDDPTTRRNFVSAFGTFDTGARLFLGREVATQILPGQIGSAPIEDGCVLHLRLIADVPQPELRGPCSSS